MSPSKRNAMINRDRTDLSLTRQCKLLKIGRSSLYYAPIGMNAETLELMNEIDRVFTKYPFFGSRQIAVYLPRNGFHAGRHRVRRLMGVMGLQEIYIGPNTSKKHPQHPIYPYLLRKLPITRPNHVWCSDITYIPVRRGLLYLVAIMGQGHAQSAGMAALEHAGRQLLCRGLKQGHRQIRQTRDNEYRSRIALYRDGLDHHPNRCQDQDLNGWPRPLSR